MYFDQVEFGKRIRKLRFENGLTQQEMSEMLGITRSYLARIEAGINGTSIDLMVDLSVRFHVSLDYLVLGIDNYEGLMRKICSMRELLSDFEDELRDRR